MKASNEFARHEAANASLRLLTAPVADEPDASAVGLLGHAADPLRYGEGITDAYESPGIMRSFVPSNARVLDVGSGTGGVTEIVNTGKNNIVLCVEPDPMRADSGKSRGLSVYAGPFDEKFAELYGKFDAITFGDVLEHIADPAKMLSIAKRCLSPGGVIILSVPNVAHWTLRVRLLIGRFDYTETGIMDATHLRWFTQKTLVTLVTNQGFEVVSLRHSAGLWMPEYRIIPYRIRKALLLPLLRVFPQLFGCQHILKARVA
jgi:SAM-dependent methyltransferase